MRRTLLSVLAGFLAAPLMLAQFGGRADEVVIYVVTAKGNPNPVIVPSTTVNTQTGFEVKDPLALPLEPFAAGLGDYRIVTTLCPGGKERMRRLMELVRHGKLDLVPFLTHTYPLDRITDAYKLFGERRDGVIKVAIRP